MAYGILAGAASGGFKATKENAEDRMTAASDEKKAAALEKRQLNLQRQGQKHAEMMATNRQSFDKKQSDLAYDRKQYDRESEIITAQGVTADDRGYEATMLAQERERANKSAGIKRSQELTDAETAHGYKMEELGEKRKDKYTATQIKGFEKADEMILLGKSIEGINATAKRYGLPGTYKEVPTGDTKKDGGTKIVYSEDGKPGQGSRPTFEELKAAMEAKQNPKPGLTDQGMMSSHKANIPDETVPAHKVNYPDGILQSGKPGKPYEEPVNIAKKIGSGLQKFQDWQRRHPIPGAK